jgi:hypothetical protein
LAAWTVVIGAATKSAAAALASAMVLNLRLVVIEISSVLLVVK